ncbi:MAG: carboxymuconolactone decarboxylase family protein [Alphaproteobacteria bacterium]
MTYLDLLGPSAMMRDLATQFPDFGRAGIEMTDAVFAMGDEVTRSELELVASYASALNRCTYCKISHGAAAQAGGVDAVSVESAESGSTPAHGGKKWEPVWDYVRMLTLSPESSDQTYITAMKEKGWSEVTILQFTLITGIYALYNRIANGLGFDASEAVLREAGKAIAARNR